MNPRQTPPSERAVAAVVGVLLIGCGMAIVYYSADDWAFGGIAAALVVGGLGLDALVSAIRDRRSFLSRIGPLP